MEKEKIISKKGILGIKTEYHICPFKSKKETLKVEWVLSKLARQDTYMLIIRCARCLALLGEAYIISVLPIEGISIRDSLVLDVLDECVKTWAQNISNASYIPTRNV